MGRKPVVKKRIALYARQSHTREGSDSIAIQVDNGHDTSARFDCEVVAVVAEPPSTSAFQNRGLSRRKFADLLNLIRSRAIDGVFVDKTDRLSRGGAPGWAPVFDAI